MFTTKTCILQQGERLLFVEMPETHAYQLTALLHRLHKEVGKLTAGGVPEVPVPVAECSDLELSDPAYSVSTGLDFVGSLEKSFSSLQENNYPLISLLTEIRALEAQLEQWYEEYEEEML
ncbi:hydrolase/acyltransferase [Paenibacillus turpanensis]|uniref:hydrolase/acyltransferase n=1 Tax=Paenibacillus turpanensis TaxID=2689078 RepID=UPI001407A61E|nr:hydrolase/acyltransferase [Paenibacillus turpanensis]